MNVFIKSIIGICIFFVLLTLMDCATIHTPQGGKKDTIPPRMVFSNPELGGKSFKGHKLEIRFDEYVQLKEAATKLVVSPPLKTQPILRLKNKSVLIQIQDTLKDSTTYTLYFGDGIADNNESNPYDDFEFFFSTGDRIDTLSIQGRILMANTLKVPKKTIIALYSNHKDSAFFNEIPDYVGKIDKEGYFSINNVRKGNYKVYAVEDGNRSFNYDQFNEAIAFSDTITKFIPIIVEYDDTVYYEGHKLDSLRNLTGSKDSLFVDSIIHISYPGIGAQYFELFMFSENRAPRYMKNYDRPEKEKFVFTFNKSLKDSLSLELLSPLTTYNHWYLTERDKNNDSIIYWLRDTTLVNTEEIRLISSYYTVDSLNQEITKQDTLSLFAPSKPKKKRRRKGKKEKDENKLRLKLSINNNARISPYDTITFDFEKPVEFIDTTRIGISYMQDTVSKILPYKLEKNTYNPRIYHLTAQWEHEKAYSLSVDTLAFFDIYDHTIDSIGVSFEVHPIEYYGNILLKCKNIPGPVIIQLLDKDKKLVQEKPLYEGNSISFKLVHPGKYNFKAILDKNKNGKWDNGNFLEHVQPEKVFLYNQEFEIKENWDFDFEWDFKQKIKKKHHNHYPPNKDIIEGSSIDSVMIRDLPGNLKIEKLKKEEKN